MLKRPLKKNKKDMKTKDTDDEVVHIVLDNVQHSLTLAEIEMLKPIINNFDEDRYLKFILKNHKSITGKVKNYSYEEIYAPLDEIIPLEITLESGDVIWFYDIKNIIPVT